MRQPKVILWDPDCPNDGFTYSSPATVDDSNGSATEPNGFSRTCSANLEALLAHFQTVTVISSMQAWSRHLFESEATNKFFVIFISASDRQLSSSPSSLLPAANTTTVDVLQFTSSQLMHISHYVVVLSDDRDSWTDLIRLGAHDVGERVIRQQDMAKYTSHIQMMKTELESRAGELKLLLGLNEHLQPYNPMRSLCTYKVGGIPDLPFTIDLKQAAKITQVLSKWDFYAHELDYDDLLLAAFIMLKHAFTIDQLDQELVLSDSRLFSFLSVVRNCYHPSNPYHNFRHAIDVMQAAFYMMVKINALPQFSGIPLETSNSLHQQTTAHHNTLSPTHSIALLISALGHDAGHPGVTNNVLISCNAPLAKIYNDRSVLESYHSAVLCQIARNYWPSIFVTADHKSFVVESILATDMAKHFDYMEKFEDRHYWDQKCKPRLIGCMIIKCADISNVTRNLDISSVWGRVLGEEFLDVAGLESALGMGSPETRKSTVTAGLSNEDESNLAKGQVFFVNTYGLPLFELLVKHFPVLHFMLDNMKSNLEFWQTRLKQLETLTGLKTKSA